MYRILIVDDERRERMGIERLIKKYAYPLEVLQAQNGEEALNVFEQIEIDILLTDIKMPFMTGIELIEQVRKRGYSPFCIIFSAYGEFEYAQNAISLGVIQYLLKPIILEDFEKLFTKVCAMCEERTKKQIESEVLRKEKKNQEMQKFTRSLMYYLEEGTLEEKEEVDLKSGLMDHLYRMLLLSSYSFLHLLHWKEYQSDIKKITGEDTWVINVDDAQLLLLMPADEDESDRFVRNCCEKLIQVSNVTYQFDVFIAVSPICSALREMRDEYEKMREIIDYQFFMSESSYILYDKECFGKKQSDMLPVYFNKILTSTKLRDLESVKKDFENVFHYIDENVGFSSLYIKYCFTDVMKKLCETMKTEYQLMDLIAKIYDAKSLETMKQVVMEYLQGMEGRMEENDSDHRLVYLAKQLVGERYQDVSLGVSAIADELHVSLAYLSRLFKLETGQPLVKYITNYRMEQAKYFLETSNMKIGDVAAHVGYLNTSYFISLFRTKEGCSPQQYREKWYDHEKA